MESYLSSHLGRIRRVAEFLCGEAGDTSATALTACLRRLCHLATSHTYATEDFRELFKRGPGFLEFSEQQLKADICVAAVFLDRQALARRLSAELVDGDVWNIPGKIRSDVFSTAFEAATLQGNVEMIDWLMPSCSKDDSRGDLVLLVQADIIRAAARYGHKEAFDFALNLAPIDVSKGKWHLGYETLRQALAVTPQPENYQRGASMFGAHDGIFHHSTQGCLRERLGDSAKYGHQSMVQYFLSRDIGSADDSSLEADATVSVSQCSCILGVSSHQPLLSAIRNGNAAIVQILLDSGFDLSLLPAVDTALMAAARKGSIPIAKLLLERNADVNEGYPPPIVMTVFNENEEMFCLLREHGAIVDTPETGGWAMAVAKYYGYQSMVDLLVREGVGEDTVLHRAAQRHEVYQHQYLFPYGAVDIWENMTANDDQYVNDYIYRS